MSSMNVAGDGNPNRLAHAIAVELMKEGGVDLRTIGAAAVNMAVKAIAIARGYLVPQGYDVGFAPHFDAGDDVTVIVLRCVRL